MITEEDRLKYFSNEINDIKDDKLRKFAEELIKNADEYFFTVAASTSGKYHPKFDLGLGGLIRHTRCVIYFAECIAESAMLNEHDRDLLIIAALAHDIKKLGDGKGQHTVKDHPTWAKKYILDMQKTNKSLITKKDADKVANAVEAHMGKWGHADCNLPLPKDEFEKYLQMADYIASRKEILDFDFRKTEMDANNNTPRYIVESKEPFTGATKDYTLAFGKNKGKTLEEIYPTGYLDWMVKQEDFFNKEAQNMAKKYLDEILIASCKKSQKKNKAEKIEVKEKDTEESSYTDDLPF